MNKVKNTVYFLALSFCESPLFFSWKFFKDSSCFQSHSWPLSNVLHSQKHAMKFLPFIKVILAYSQPFFHFLSVFCPCLFHASFLTFIWHSFTLLEPSTVHHTESIYMSPLFSPAAPPTTVMFSVVSLSFHLFLGCSFRFSSSSYKINSTVSPSPLCSVIKNNVLLDRRKNKHTHIQSQEKP